MGFGALVAMGTVIGAVYAFLGNYATDGEVKAQIRAHSVGLVDKDQPLPHNNRFTRIETELTAFRDTQAKDQEIITLLKVTDKETMKILVRRIVADLEIRKTHKMEKGHAAEEIFDYWLKKGEPPIEALRRAVRACRKRSCEVPFN